MLIVRNLAAYTLMLLNLPRGGCARTVVEHCSSAGAGACVVVRCVNATADRTGAEHSGGRARHPVATERLLDVSDLISCDVFSATCSGSLARRIQFSALAGNWQESSGARGYRRVRGKCQINENRL